MVNIYSLIPIFRYDSNLTHELMASNFDMIIDLNTKLKLQHEDWIRLIK
jgi:hypothetical protein